MARLIGARGKIENGVKNINLVFQFADNKIATLNISDPIQPVVLVDCSGHMYSPYRKIANRIKEIDNVEDFSQLFNQKAVSTIQEEQMEAVAYTKKIG